MSTEEDKEVEEDYMSDTFIAPGVNDIRPSLLFTHRLRIEHESMKKKLKTDPKPKSYYNELEKELREEAMNKPIDKSNKGFKLLEKMGFNSRTSDETNDTNVVKSRPFCEPIKIELKNDRKGLGCVKPKPKSGVNSGKLTENSDKINDKVIEEKFLSHRKSRNQLFLLENDFKTAQKICRNLDLESGIDDNAFLAQTVRPKWFWPPIDDQSTDEEEHEEEEEEEETDCESSIEEMFKSINDYLREKYFFCIWCGIRFNDTNDLNENCLGDTRDQH